MSAERGIGMTSARTRERLIRRLVEQGIRDARVLDRIRNVPRHLFVDEALASRAYEDTALPIGHGQTISQPYVVARMTEALTIGGTPEKVLEIGTGCGYQNAVLSPLVGRIYSIERIEPLLERAKERLRDLGIRNVRFKHGDGAEGWPFALAALGLVIAAVAVHRRTFAVALGPEALALVLVGLLLGLSLGAMRTNPPLNAANAEPAAWLDVQRWARAATPLDSPVNSASMAAIRFSTAASALSSPARPTIAATTVSTSSAAAARTKASGPKSVRLAIARLC